MEADLELRYTNLLRFIVDDRYRVLRHLVLLLATLLVIFYSNWQEKYSGSYKYYRLLCVYGVLVGMSYFNMFLLVPHFFFKGKYLLYLGLLSLMVLVCLWFMDTLLHSYLTSIPEIATLGDNDDERGFYEGFIMLMSVILMTTMVKLFQRWTRDNGRIAELKNIALSMELKELKNQINPHFLFNMLNGIKALVRTDPEKATVVIMKLSEFLRYQIYENNDDRAMLSAEVTFLSNFLNLEMLRRDNLSIDIVLPKAQVTLQSIFLPPNLFTTFVENAVKHSVDINGNESTISIKIDVSERQIQFLCINSVDPDFIAADKKHSGLGLVNIKRRLELLYGQKYSLAVLAEENKFTVTLFLPL